jgi:hypothetical protein
MMSRAPVIPIVVALALATVVSARAAPALADDAADDAAPAAPARVVLVSAPGVFGDLAGRILDVVDVPGGIEIGRAERLRADEVFRVKGTDAKRATVWVTVDGTTAWVRAADAERERFVFRDLAVSAPISELDRERLCQVLASGLATIAEDGAGAIGRADAQAAMGIAPAPPPPVVTQQVFATETRPIPRVEWSLGAVYEAQRTEAGPAHGPGIVATAWANRQARRPGAWLVTQYDIGYKSARTGGGGGVWKDGVSLRAGAGLDATWWMRVEAGGGVDLVRLHASDVYSPGLTRSSVEIIPVARLAARFAVSELFGIRMSATAVLDIARSSIHAYISSQTVVVDPISPVTTDVGAYYVTDDFSLHPGLGLELWWR